MAQGIVWQKSSFSGGADAANCVELAAVDGTVVRGSGRTATGASCGRPELTDDGAAVLEIGGSQILFDLASPLPESIDGAWVEIRAEADSVVLGPHLI